MWTTREFCTHRGTRIEGGRNSTSALSCPSPAAPSVSRDHAAAHVVRCDREAAADLHPLHPTAGEWRRVQLRCDRSCSPLQLPLVDGERRSPADAADAACSRPRMIASRPLLFLDRLRCESSVDRLNDRVDAAAARGSSSCSGGRRHAGARATRCDRAPVVCRCLVSCVLFVNPRFLLARLCCALLGAADAALLCSIPSGGTRRAAAAAAEDSAHEHDKGDTTHTGSEHDTTRRPGCCVTAAPPSAPIRSRRSSPPPRSVCSCRRVVTASSACMLDAASVGSDARWCV